MNQHRFKLFITSNSFLLLLPLTGLLAVCWLAIFQTDSPVVAQQPATTVPHPAINVIKPHEGSTQYHLEQVHVAHAAPDGTIIHQSIPRMVPDHHNQPYSPIPPNYGWNGQSAMQIPPPQSPQEHELMMRIGALIAEFSNEGDSGRKDAARERLKEAVNEHFGQLNDRRKKEIALHEERLKQAQETQRKREIDREKIVAAQVDRLLGAPDSMDWNPPLLAPAAAQTAYGMGFTTHWMPTPVGASGSIQFQNLANPQTHNNGGNPYQPTNNNFHPIPGNHWVPTNPRGIASPNQ